MPFHRPVSQVFAAAKATQKGQAQAYMGRGEFAAAKAAQKVQVRAVQARAVFAAAKAAQRL